MKLWKAVRCDEIPNEVLKVPGVWGILCKLFNVCFEKSLILSVWKSAIIKPIPKGKLYDKYCPVNYCCISLISCSAKLHTTELNNRLVTYCDKTACIEEEQAGFQWKYACIDQAFILNSVIKQNARNKGMYAVFIDMQKCFDWVDRDLLFYRMLNKHITDKFYHSIMALYSDSTSTIRINNRYTNQFQVKVGVKQGEVLSPNCVPFLSDLSEVIKKAKLGIPCRNLMVSLLLYADDIVILQKILKICNAY